jgi:predicted ATPase
MLTRFSLSNFKSYKDARIQLRPLTFLVGANASGKTNLIEALRLASWLGEGRRLHDVHGALRDRSLILRGHGPALLRSRKSPMSLRCRVRVGEDRFRVKVQLKVESNGMQISGEEFQDVSKRDSTLPFYSVIGPAAEGGNDLAVEYNNFARGGHKPQIVCTNQQAVFTQLRTPARFAERHVRSQRLISAACEAMASALANIVFLDPVPSAMRDYSFIEDRMLRPDGQNLSAVLYDICHTQRRTDEVLKFVRALPEQDITGISFIKTPRAEVLVQILEQFGKMHNEWDASALSDGTLRILAIAAAVLSVPEGALVVLEELDNGVHPSRTKTLVAELNAAAQRRRVQLLITTHNPALLDAVPDEAVPDISFCFRSPDGGDSQIMRLDDIEDYPSLMSQGRVGDLLTRGLIDRFVKHPRTPEVRKMQAASFLESLAGEPK